MRLCNYCGREYTEARHKYADRCEECSRRYNKYTAYKSMQRKNFTFIIEHKLEEIRLEYIELKAKGFKVPKDISDKLTLVSYEKRT